jgi:hypothetical protein
MAVAALLLTFTEIVDLFGVISWPLVIVIALIILLVTPRGSEFTKRIFSRVNSVKFMGTELELSADTARQITGDVLASFEAYRKLVDAEYRRQIRIYGIQSQFEVVAQKVVNRVGNQKEFQLRCAIHINDLMYPDLLYQLTSYYPSRDGQGRTKSIRFGIIGRAWREGEPRAQGHVVPEKLVSDWGMTKIEADSAGQNRQSMLATVLLDHNHVQVAVFYLDAMTQNAFGSQNQINDLHEFIRSECNDAGLPNTLDSLKQEMSKTVASLNIK